MTDYAAPPELKTVYLPTYKYIAPNGAVAKLASQTAKEYAFGVIPELKTILAAQAFALRSILIVICFVLGLGFRAYGSPSSTSTNTPVQLTPEMFSDYEFTLISKKDHLYYYFRDNGSVEETFGQTALVALAEGWRIEHGNTLVFTGVPDGIGAVPNPVRHTLQFKSFGEKIVVTADGQKFRRSKLKPPD